MPSEPKSWRQVIRRNGVFQAALFLRWSQWNDSSSRKVTLLAARQLRQLDPRYSSRFSFSWPSTLSCYAWKRCQCRNASNEKANGGSKSLNWSPTETLAKAPRCSQSHRPCSCTKTPTPTSSIRRRKVRRVEHILFHLPSLSMGNSKKGCRLSSQPIADSHSLRRRIYNQRMVRLADSW